MGRLTSEIEQDIELYYKNQEGHLIVITNGNEACDISSRLDEFCKNCELPCMASSPVISLGEIKPYLRGSNLSAVGPIGIGDRKACPLVKNINLYTEG